MKMYMWWSSALQNYAPGNIIVMAASVEEARAKALDSIPRIINEKWDWLDEDYMADERAEKTKLFEKDLAEEPTEHETIFLSGGE